MKRATGPGPSQEKGERNPNAAVHMPPSRICYCRAMNGPGDDTNHRVVNCAGALIVREGRILLGLRSPFRDMHPNVWDIFGGHIEAEESIEQALVRELREELDIAPTEFSFLTTLTENHRNERDICVYHLFRVTSWTGTGPKLCGTEHTRIEWHTLDEALSLKLAMPEYEPLLRENIVPNGHREDPHPN